MCPAPPRAQLCAPPEYHNVHPSGKPRRQLVGPNDLDEGPKVVPRAAPPPLMSALVAAAEAEDEAEAGPFAGGGSPATPVGPGGAGAGGRAWAGGEEEEEDGDDVGEGEGEEGSPAQSSGGDGSPG